MQCVRAGLDPNLGARVICDRADRPSVEHDRELCSAHDPEGAGEPQCCADDDRLSVFGLDVLFVDGLEPMMRRSRSKRAETTRSTRLLATPSARGVELGVLALTQGTLRLSAPEAFPE